MKIISSHKSCSDKYEAYKYSGVDWIGEIPEGWEVRKLKFICDVYNGDSLNENQKKQYSSDNQSHLPYISSRDIDVNFSTANYENGLRIPVGKYFKVATKFSTLLCIEGGSAGRKITYLNQDVSFVNKLACFKSYNGINSMYVYYSLKGVAFRTQFFNSLTGLIGGVSISNIKNFCLTFPPLSEQTAIAEFLDNKTAKIDQTIGIRQKEVELLKERRQILIQQAVTGKIVWDASTNAWTEPVEVKPSGVDWIGEIPEHWEVRKLKYVVYMQSGETITAESFTDEGYSVMGGNGFRGYTNRYTNDGNFILIGRQGALCGNVNYAQGKFFATEHAIVVYPNKDVLDILWLGEVIKLADLNNLSQTAAQPGISVTQIKNVIIPFIPQSEQLQIVEYLKKIEEKISKAISIKEQEIEKLKEYKTVLIDNVVTGKIRVC